MSWLRFLHIIIFLLCMPLIVVTSTSRLVLNTSPVAQWPTTQQVMPAGRMALWNQPLWVFVRVGASEAQSLLLRKEVLAFLPLTRRKTGATECSVLMAVVTMDANANLFLHLIHCGSKIQWMIPANVNTYLHSDLLTSGFAGSHVEDV